MRIAGRRRSPRIDLEPVEIAILVQLFTDLADLAADTDSDDPVVARLYPDAYLDAEDSAEFRELTRESMRGDRVQRAMDCIDDLQRAREDASSVSLADPAVADRWLRALTDLRLALGTRLGVTADGGWDEPGEREGEPAGDGRHIYHWLSAMQEAMVAAVSR